VRCAGLCVCVGGGGRCRAARQVGEVDEPWEFNTLLQEVAQAMQADIDKKEADDKDSAPF
jgi:hypothetical protein